MNRDAVHSTRNGSQVSVPDVLLRTRRSVMEAAYEIQAQRVRQRRQIGIALLVFAGLVVLATPALWSAATELTSGEPFFDMPVMLLTLTLVLLSAIFAVLLVSWRGQRLRDEQR
jgi:cytochrome bd-type quinol oxidase subunit 2